MRSHYVVDYVAACMLLARARIIKGSYSIWLYAYALLIYTNC